MNTRVIHIRERTGSDNEVYIGRGSKWGNPYRIGTHGDRAAVLRRYAEYLINRPDLREAARRELRGKTLVCFCSPAPCHGDLLAACAELTRDA